LLAHSKISGGRWDDKVQIKIWEIDAALVIYISAIVSNNDVEPDTVSGGGLIRIEIAM
jgi:hypothetical protein